MLRDPDIDPADVAPAGWALLRRAYSFWEGTAAGQHSDAARALEGDDLVLALLEEAPVDDRTVERVLTCVRRWLAGSGRWRSYPRLTRALVAQAALNGGAWLFDDAERGWITAAGPPLTHLYLPENAYGSTESVADHMSPAAGVAADVARQYERWPYPAWRRITRPAPGVLGDVVREYDAPAASIIPRTGRLLIAGCGTGRQAAILAATYPDAHITAIDVSASSLEYARARCAALGIPHVRFERLDLHDVGACGRDYDVIFCDGVLHHLADPEGGWAALTRVLKPGGVMHVMLYSRLARMTVDAARDVVRDLLAKPVTDDLLRAARGRLLQHYDCEGLRPVLDSADFSTLVGTHDLLFHRHEDRFDIPRIARTLRALDLRLLAFVLPSPAAADCYAALFPSDSRHRDLASWKLFELGDPNVFARMYEFWCVKPADGAAAPPSAGC